MLLAAIGSNMKVLLNSGLLVFCVLSFISCVDPTVSTEIKVINNSTYDLHIILKLDDLSANRWGDDDFLYIDVLRNQSKEFMLLTFMGSHHPIRNPNEEIEKITFSNLENNEIICELENIPGLFILDYIHEDEIYGGKTAYYKFEITDSLLNIEE